MADLGSNIDTPVYIGIWTNWSRGRINGSTLTLSHRNGALLTAFLAIYVTFVGTSFWRIASYTLHQLYSSSEPQDGLYHQSQAILRNAGNGTTSLMRLLHLLWAWWRKTNRPFYRMTPLILSTFLCTASFAVASIFSARISSGLGNEVLLSGNSCGIMNSSYSNYSDGNLNDKVLLPYISKLTNNYANYVQTCYSNTSVTDGCNTFMKRQLASTIDRNANCPFQEKICRHQDRNIVLDSGPINIASDLGFNVPMDLQYTFRAITHCAPLATEGYKQVFNDSSGASYMRYYYGQVNPVTASDVKGPNCTVENQIVSIPQVLSEDMRIPSPDYALR